MKTRNQKTKIRNNVQAQIPKCVIVTLLIISSFWLARWSFANAMSKTADANQAKTGVFVGVFRQGAPESMAYITKYEEQMGKKPAMVMWYQDWAQKFPQEDIKKVLDYGAIPHIVWEPWHWSDHNKISLQDIVDGKWDDYIASWAKGVKGFDKPVFLRVAHEFNIDGYPWGVIHNNKDPKLYIAAYRHVVDIFKREKAANVKWVWCFMNYSYPEESWNDWVAAYPGDEYVDWVGIDGYNWGTTQDWSQWQAFKYLFRDQIRLSKKLWPDKPIMIAEFSSAEKGGDKAAWIRELPGYLKSSMRDIDLIVWFDLDKETDWRIKSSKAACQAYKEIMADPFFLSSGEDLAKFVPVTQPKKQLPKKTVFALKAKQPLKIDGDLSDWDKGAPITMVDEEFFKEGLTWGGNSDLSGKAYIMWDETNFYLAAEIIDDLPLVNDKVGANIWNGDALELVLGFNQKADPQRVAMGQGDFQVGFGTGDGKKNPPQIWNWQRRRIPKGGEIAVNKTKSPLGYVLEAKIPWEFFRVKSVPKKGLRLGFDIAFDDADKRNERERQFIWNGDYYFYKDPSVWGVLELK